MKPTYLSLAIAAALSSGWLIAQESPSKPEEPRAAADSPLPPSASKPRTENGNPPPRADRSPRRDGYGEGERRGNPGGPYGPPRRGNGPGGPENRPFPPEGGRPFRDGGPEGPPGNRPGPYANPNLPLKLQPYLGVVTRPSPVELNLQLKLPEGFGLIVDDVLDDSPAKQADLRRGDLLRLLDDQWLVNPNQLEALVRRSGKDKEVALTILREGSEQKITVKIAEKMLPVRRPPPPFGGFPEGPRDSFNDRDGDRPRPENGGRSGGDFRDAQDRQTRYVPERARVLRRDDSGEYELQRIDGHRIFTARKMDGEVQWKGPVDTEDERKAMPEELRKKFNEIEQSRPLERLERGNPEARPGSGTGSDFPGGGQR